MAGLSAYGEGQILTPLTTNGFVSLHTADPGLTGTSEVSGGSYARQGPITFTNAGSEPTVASNSSILTFPAATAAWGTISFFGLWDAVTAGNFRGSGALTANKAINSGDTARFLANALTITAQ
jgi:hypothetical protein